jgi:hypothetical protein
MTFDPIGARDRLRRLQPLQQRLRADGEHLRFNDVAMTMMACADSRNPRRDSSRS